MISRLGDRKLPTLGSPATSGGNDEYSSTPTSCAVEPSAATTSVADGVSDTTRCAAGVVAGAAAAGAGAGAASSRRQPSAANAASAARAAAGAIDDARDLTRCCISPGARTAYGLENAVENALGERRRGGYREGRGTRRSHRCHP